MLTAVISDLHLGTRTRADLLRSADLRRRLLGALEGVDQVVLLGDTIELRDGPAREAVAEARLFFEELGRSLAGGRIVLVPGNHDHQLAAGVLGRGSQLLALEQLVPAAQSPALRALSASAGGAELTLAYPGFWIRPDVYATHGHYMDRHHRAPTFECTAAGVLGRVRGLPPENASPADYEAVVGPLYRTMFAVAQAPRLARPAGAAKALIRAAERATGARPRQRGPGGGRPRALGAMAEVVRRLGIDAAHVIFGHTHRPGPLAGDADGWQMPGGPRLVNSGCWIYEPPYLGETASGSSHWPGTCVFVDASGPPRVQGLLADVSAGELDESCRSGRPI